MWLVCLDFHKANMFLESLYLPHMGILRSYHMVPGPDGSLLCPLPPALGATSLATPQEDTEPALPLLPHSPEHKDALRQQTRTLGAGWTGSRQLGTWAGLGGMRWGLRKLI